VCDRWGKDYRTIKLLRNNADYKACMAYLNYAPVIQTMIYTNNWIERLNRDFRRVTHMRAAMPNEDSVLTLIGNVPMDHKALAKTLPNITFDKALSTGLTVSLFRLGCAILQLMLKLPHKERPQASSACEFDTAILLVGIPCRGGFLVSLVLQN
jgi:hypothetical protein